MNGCVVSVVTTSACVIAGRRLALSARVSGRPRKIPGISGCNGGRGRSSVLGRGCNSSFGERGCTSVFGLLAAFFPRLLLLNMMFIPPMPSVLNIPRPGGSRTTGGSGGFRNFNCLGFSGSETLSTFLGITTGTVLVTTLAVARRLNAGADFFLGGVRAFIPPVWHLHLHLHVQFPWLEVVLHLQQSQKWQEQRHLHDAGHSVRFV
jgi:hypothetical protein